MDAIEWARWVRERSGDGSGGAIGQLEAEIAEERATTLSQLGRRLDEAVARLAAIRERATESGVLPDLVAEDRAGLAALRELRWEYTVVKEAMGLRGIRAELDRFWPVPSRLR